MKYINFRIRRNGFVGKRASGKYYKSYIEQMRHDWRIEEMDEGYLARPHLQSENLYKSWHDLDETNIKRLWSKAQGRYKERWGRSLPSNTQPIITGLVSFSHTMIDDIYLYGKEKMFQVMNEFLRIHFEESVIYNTFQNEESVGHYQFVLLNYDDGKNTTISNQINTAEFQTKVADFFKSKIAGFDYVRGIPKQESNAKHIEVRQSQKIAMEKQQKELEKLKDENAQLEITINEHQKRIDDAKTVEKVLYDDIGRLNDEKTELQTSVDESKKEIGTLLIILNELIEDIIALGEEDKGQNMLQTLAKYVKAENKDKLEALKNKAERIKQALLRPKNNSPKMR